MWDVIRQDTHGNRFVLASFATEAAALAKVAEMEAGYPHHQAYFVVRRAL